MVVTEKLQLHFDNNREVERNKLDYLLSLGIDPKFARKCVEMFEEIWATTNEILNQEENILAANEQISKIEIKRNRLQRVEVLKISA